MYHALYDHGYGLDWTDLFIEQREGYYTSVSDFHQHPFYEINLILSGNIKILLKDRVVDGSGNFVVLTRPRVPHFISCSPDLLYRRLYLSFSPQFIEEFYTDRPFFSNLFGEGGRIIALSPEQTALCKQKIEEIRKEYNPFRQRLLTLCLLSHIAEFEPTKHTDPVATPKYIVDALSYLGEHYAEKIVAEDLARRLFICRTTLMTAFKKYTGSTLNDYLTRLRLNHALGLLNEGISVQEAAAQCGFGDSGSFIRCFKRHYQTTPRQYLLQKNNGHSPIL